MVIIYFLNEFLGHPFVLTILVFLFGLRAWKYYLDEKTIDLKINIIKKIINIKNKLKYIKFFYDRINTTYQDANKKGKLEKKDYKESFKEELNKISNLINDEIPILEMELNSDISVYFIYNEKIMDKYKKYFNELRKINDHLILAESSKDVMSKWCDFSLITMDDYDSAENDLIKHINNSATIYKDLRLKNK